MPWLPESADVHPADPVSFGAMKSASTGTRLRTLACLLAEEVEASSTSLERYLRTTQHRRPPRWREETYTPRA